MNGFLLSQKNGEIHCYGADSIDIETQKVYCLDFFILTSVCLISFSDSCHFIFSLLAPLLSKIVQAK
jgi:hypothetical protein